MEIFFRKTLVNCCIIDYYISYYKKNIFQLFCINKEI